MVAPCWGFFPARSYLDRVPRSHHFFPPLSGTFNYGWDSFVGWSPDGESVVFSSEGQIYTYNVALGTTPRQLTFEGDNIHAVFSPDGTRVAFRSVREGTDGADLFVKDLNDDSPPRSIITLDGNQNVMQWPSDTLIVLERGEGGFGDLWMVNLSDPDNPSAEAYLSSEANLRGSRSHRMAPLPRIGLMSRDRMRSISAVSPTRVSGQSFHRARAVTPIGPRMETPCTTPRATANRSWPPGFSEIRCRWSWPRIRCSQDCLVSNPAQALPSTPTVIGSSLLGMPPVTLALKVKRRSQSASSSSRTSSRS